MTPAVAVVREILKLRPRAEIEFWTDFKYYNNVTKLTTEIGVSWGDEEKEEHREVSKGVGPYIRVRRIPSGKFHRYSGWKLKDYFDHIDLTIKELIFGNICGFFGFLAGIVVTFLRLLAPKRRPDAIFLKGGYVSLPVGLVASWLNIPFVIHESDAVPGLANRILMKKATKVAFGVPLSDKTKAEHPNYIWTGVPVGSKFKRVSESRQKTLKKKFSFDPERTLVVITGGSQGAENLNEATREILPEMLKYTSVGLIAGRRHYEDMVDLKKYENWEKANLQSDFRMWEFCTTMDELLGAADVVVTRAGATTLAELAALGKAVILVPFEVLPGAHQLKNAERLEKAGAALMLRDSKMLKHPDELLEMIKHLVRSPRERELLAEKLQSEAKSDAAEKLAEIVLETAGRAA